MYPLRLRFGLRVVGAWKVGEGRFVWIPGYEGEKGEFEEANEGYYNSMERKAARQTPRATSLRSSLDN